MPHCPLPPLDLWCGSLLPLSSVWARQLADEIGQWLQIYMCSGMELWFDLLVSTSIIIGSLGAPYDLARTAVVLDIGCFFLLLLCGRTAAPATFGIFSEQLDWLKTPCRTYWLSIPHECFWIFPSSLSSRPIPWEAWGVLGVIDRKWGDCCKCSNGCLEANV